MESKMSAWLFKTGFLEEGAEDDHRQNVIIAILMFTGSVVISVLSLWDLYSGMGPAWVNVTTLLTGLFGGLTYFLLVRQGRNSLPLILGLMIFLHFFWLITGDVEWAGMFWCLVMVPLFFHLLGHSGGGKLVFVLLFPSLWLLFLPTPGALMPPYTPEISMRFVVAYVVLAWISYLVEFVRYQTRVRLKQARDRLDVQSRTDELTGLANRRGFKEYLGQQEKRGDQGRGWYAVIVGDLDDFKAINDRYGHEVGDAVLRQVGATLKGIVRDVDLVARWGGEEFLLLLVDTDRDGALVLAEKILAKIDHSTIRVADLEISVTMSLGVDAQQPGRSLSAALRNADRAMYLAKERGKNQVVAHQPHSERVGAAELGDPA